MDAISNKAIVIAVAIFITIAITSAIFVSIGLMRDVYSDVYETDITISSGFQEFDEYDGTEKTGLDLLNTLNKYLGNKNVHVNVGTAHSDENNKGQEYINNTYKNKNYNKKYNCSVIKNGDIVTITFNP